MRISSMITCFSVSKSSSRKRGADDVAQQFDGAGLIFGQHGRVVDRVLFAGEGVVVGPHLVELAIYVVGRAGRRALEHHVFEKMAHARDLVGLVASAGLHEEAQRGRMRLGVALGHDLQPIGERMLTKLQRAPPTAGAQRDNGEITRRMRGQVGIDAVARKRVDQRAHLVQRAHAAQMIPIAGDRAAARRTRFLLHDQAALDAGLEPGQLVGSHARGQPGQFAQRHVERLLRALGAGAGIAQHAAAIAQRMHRGVDAVAQPALLAHFGEQSRAHAAAQHADGPPSLKIIGMPIGQAGVCDADLRLVRLVMQVFAFGQRSAGGGLARLAPRPVVEQCADAVFELFPIEMPGHSQDRAVGTIAALEKIADLCQADRFERSHLAVAGTAPGVGILVAAQLEHDLLSGLVLDGLQFLQHHEAHGFELVGRQMRPAQQIGENLEGRNQVLGERGAAEAGVAVGNALAPLDAQVFQVLHELAAIARAGAAQRHLASE